MVWVIVVVDGDCERGDVGWCRDGSFNWEEGKGVIEIVGNILKSSGCGVGW